jgi:hypothetical protein
MLRLISTLCVSELPLVMSASSMFRRHHNSPTFSPRASNFSLHKIKIQSKHPFYQWSDQYLLGFLAVAGHLPCGSRLDQVGISPWLCFYKSGRLRLPWLGSYIL